MMMMQWGQSRDWMNTKRHQRGDHLYLRRKEFGIRCEGIPPTWEIVSGNFSYYSSELDLHFHFISIANSKSDQSQFDSCQARRESRLFVPENQRKEKKRSPSSFGRASLTSTFF